MECNFKLWDEVRRAACGMHKLNREIALFETAGNDQALRSGRRRGRSPHPRIPEKVRKMLPVEMAKWANVARVANSGGQ
jgi:hypothetical protein